MTSRSISLAEAEKGGSILMGHGLLLPSALLLEKKLALDEGRLLDFGALMNALVLHDKLVTLPATIPAHIKESKLYSYLEERHLLYTLDISFDKIEGIKQLMERYQMTEEDASTVLGDLRYQDEGKEKDQGNGKIYKYIEKWKPEKLDNEREHIKEKRSTIINRILESTPEDLLAADEERNYLLNSKEEGMRIHTLRTIFYYNISDNKRIPFIPDFLRIPIIAGYDLRLFESVRMYFQTAADNKTREKFEKIIREQPIVATIPIPGVTVKFLKTYDKTKENLPETIDALREDFHPTRKSVVEIEEKLRRGSIAELEKANEQIKSREEFQSVGLKDLGEIVLGGASISLKALKLDFDLDQSVRLGEKVGKIYKTHTNRANMSFYYSNIEEAEALTDEESQNLLRNTFGDSLTVPQKRRFLQLAAHLSKLIKPPISIPHV